MRLIEIELAYCSLHELAGPALANRRHRSNSAWLNPHLLPHPRPSPPFLFSLPFPSPCLFPAAKRPLKIS